MAHQGVPLAELHADDHHRLAARRERDRAAGAVTVDYGPLALDYVLAGGGAGYFRMGMVRPLIGEGKLALVPDSPEFSYPSYMIHSTRADESAMARIRRGLRAAAALSA